MLRVLIAEDEWLVAFTLRAQLEERSCEVVGVAKNGAEALEMCQQEQPDVILMDIRMPKVDGLDATKQIMLACPTCIVMLTACGENSHAMKAEEVGAMAYLTKPVSAEQILPAIELAQRRFSTFQFIYSETADLKSALQARKLMEKAQELLMKQERLSESDAFCRLKTLAAESQISLREAAQTIVSTA